MRQRVYFQWQFSRLAAVQVALKNDITSLCVMLARSVNKLHLFYLKKNFLASDYDVVTYETILRTGGAKLH